MAQRPSQWQDGVTLSGNDLRLAQSLSWAPEYRAGSLFRTRSGLIPANTALAPLYVGQLPSPALQVTVAPGSAVIFGDSSETQGAYTYVNDSSVTLNFSNSNTTNDRIDAVVVSADETANPKTVKLSVVTGIPASIPSAPTSIPGILVVATVRVRAGATQILDSDIVNQYTYTISRGGVLPVISLAKAPINVYEGFQIMAMDTNISYQSNGANVWVPNNLVNSYRNANSDQVFISYSQGQSASQTVSRSYKSIYVPVASTLSVRGRVSYTLPIVTSGSNDMKLQFDILVDGLSSAYPGPVITEALNTSTNYSNSLSVSYEAFRDVTVGNHSVAVAITPIFGAGDNRVSIDSTSWVATLNSVS